jgi:hypothetical protein
LALSRESAKCFPHGNQSKENGLQAGEIFGLQRPLAAIAGCYKEIDRLSFVYFTDFAAFVNFTKIVLLGFFARNTLPFDCGL